MRNTWQEKPFGRCATHLSRLARLARLLAWSNACAAVCAQRVSSMLTELALTVDPTASLGTRISVLAHNLGVNFHLSTVCSRPEDCDTLLEKVAILEKAIGRTRARARALEGSAPGLNA